MVKTIVVDIDGTIANIEHRLKFVENKPKDWAKFYSEEQMLLDKPIENNIAIVADLGISFHIVFCTGRPERLREITENFLNFYLEKEYHSENFDFKLLMRKDGDKRADDIIKPELLENAGLRPDNVLVILEDRVRNVVNFRKLGFNVFQVAEGNF